MEAGGPPPPRAQSTAWLGLAHQSKASGLQSGLQAHDVQPIDRKLCLKAIVRAVLVELRGFEPTTITEQTCPHVDACVASRASYCEATPLNPFRDRPDPKPNRVHSC